MRKILNSKFKILNSKLGQRGSIMIYNILIIFIFSTVMVGILSVATSQLRLLRSSISRESSFNIAEAGINYYIWHLAHFQSDYADGTGQTGCNPCGPYVHNYTDTDNATVIGKFSLTITPPLLGSTVVTIKSTGYTLADPGNKRTITAQYGIPSLAQYSFLSNADAWIGSTEAVHGQFRNNGGVRFDGSGDSWISSAKNNLPPGPGYQCSPLFGCCPALTKPGIWGAAGASTQAFWKMAQPNVNFAGITGDLNTIKANAQASGIDLAPSNSQGYSLVFKSDGTFDTYKVTSLKSNPTGYSTNCTYNSAACAAACNSTCTNSIQCEARNDKLDYNARTFLNNRAIPANGIIFVEDNAWVEGTVKGRALVVAARLGSSLAGMPNIFIPNNILYNDLTANSNDILGLLSQKDIIITYLAPSTLTIDAAMIAQNGVVNFFDYSAGCTTTAAQKTTLNLFGSLASYGVWTWTWTCGNGVYSGYLNTNTTYDGRLLYYPPPSFPVDSAAGYQQLNWKSN